MAVLQAVGDFDSSMPGLYISLDIQEDEMRRLSLAAMIFTLFIPGVELFSQAHAGVEKVLEAKEQTSWQAWKDHDPKSIADMTPENYVGIADGAVAKGKEQLLSGTASQDCKVNSFSLSGFSYLWLDKTTVMMIYTATQDATCAGKKQPQKVIASSLWQKTVEGWMMRFHQETAAGI
jgi:hypothetical protein